MNHLIPILLVIHVVPAAFWFGASGVLSHLGTQGATLPLRGPQAGSAIVTIGFGGALWVALGHRLANPNELVLALGALAALGAFTLQQAIAWPALGRGEEGRAKFASAQRISAVLLVLALICMVTFRYI